MTWQQALTHLAYDAETGFDRFKYRMFRRLDADHPLKILPYRGYGTPDKVYLKGRVLEDDRVRPAADNDTVWRNMLNMYRRIDSHEVPGVRVQARLGSAEQEVKTDEEGFFEVSLELPRPLAGKALWHPMQLELLLPAGRARTPVRAVGQVLVPRPSARFLVISDIDDTVLKTDATSALRMARNVFLGNAHTRLPFPGAAAFYRALHYGAGGHELNPLFYVSSSPWNLYDLLSDFFNLQEIPVGPVLFLRDWGLTRDEILPLDNRAHKLAIIRRILDLYVDLPVILIGDSGQQDPEVYEQVTRDFPRRIRAVYIRNVSRNPRRLGAIRALAEKVVTVGSTLILADNTLPLAQHAAAQGWISPAALPGIGAEKQADAALAGPLETLLGEKAEGPTVVVEGESRGATAAAVKQGAVEEALKAGDQREQKPPTVVVKPQEQGKKR